jgi:hypothetical protein
MSGVGRMWRGGLGQALDLRLRAGAGGEVRAMNLGDGVGGGEPEKAECLR